MAPRPCCYLRLLQRGWDAGSTAKIFAKQPCAKGPAAVQLLLPGSSAVRFRGTGGPRADRVAIDFANVECPLGCESEELDVLTCAPGAFSEARSAVCIRELCQRYPDFVSDCVPALKAANEVWCSTMMESDLTSLAPEPAHSLMLVANDRDPACDVPPGLYRLYCGQPAGCHLWSPPDPDLPSRITWPVPAAGRTSAMLILNKDGPFGADPVLDRSQDNTVTDLMRDLMLYCGVPQEYLRRYSKRGCAPPGPALLVFETAQRRVELRLNCFASLQAVVDEVPCHYSNYGGEFVAWSCARQAALVKFFVFGLLYEQSNVCEAVRSWNTRNPEAVVTGRINPITPYVPLQLYRCPQRLGRLPRGCAGTARVVVMCLAEAGRPSGHAVKPDCALGLPVGYGGRVSAAGPPHAPVKPNRKTAHVRPVDEGILRELVDFHRAAIAYVAHRFERAESVKTLAVWDSRDPAHYGVCFIAAHVEPGLLLTLHKRATCE